MQGSDNNVSKDGNIVAGTNNNEKEDNSSKDTVNPSLTYSRRSGTLTVNGNDIDDNYDDFYSNDTNNNDNDYLDDFTTAIGIGDDNIHGFSHAADRKLKVEEFKARKALASSQLSQWNYKNNRISLNRSILQVKDLLNNINTESEMRPIYIPNHDNTEESLSVLRLELKIDGNYGKNGDFNLDKQALATLFKSQINVAQNHLRSIQKRIDDVSSKVFITGDVNTGKSNFCNSLLKRSILPEDQLPCTNVFCEILEAKENNSIEEVHAISCSVAHTVKDANLVYNIKDSSTYDVYNLDELHELVQESKKYVLLKIYIKDDKTPAENSLLRNGIVNISLIDSPGLNINSIQTAEVMARQEEIDLVVFVVNAENQLTLSAREFITLASKEKKLMFFVVKKFDKIRDKQRCKDLILKQIKDLSPETHKLSSEFVHFIEGSDDNGPDKDPNNDDNDGNSYDEPNPDFENLENSLRNFVLKKRSLSKLLPAKTYLVKLLTDIEILSKCNTNVYLEEDRKIAEELDDLKPELESVTNRCTSLTNRVDKLVETTRNFSFDFTKNNISNSLILSLYDFPRYEGLSQIHDFIFHTEQFILNSIKAGIQNSEAYAKTETLKAVEKINSLGKERLGDDFMSGRVFNSDLMFTKRSHSQIKKLNAPLSITDLFAPTWNGFLLYISCGIIKNPWTKSDELTPSAHKESGLTQSLGFGNYSFYQYWLNPSLLFTSKLPALMIYSLGGAKVAGNLYIQGIQFFSWKLISQLSGPFLVVSTLLGASYLIHDLPRALPNNLLKKYREQLLKLDYMYANADRISKEVDNVLRVPVREILKSCELVLDKKLTFKKDLEKKRTDNRLSMKFFEKIMERASSQKSVIDSINLDID